MSSRSKVQRLHPETRGRGSVSSLQSLVFTHCVSRVRFHAVRSTPSLTAFGLQPVSLHPTLALSPLHLFAFFPVVFNLQPIIVSKSLPVFSVFVASLRQSRVA